MKWLRAVFAIFLSVGTLLGFSSVAYADDPAAGETSAAIDICATGTAQVDVTVSDGSHHSVSAYGAKRARLHFTAVADTVFDICITGDGEADIDVSGPCEVNIKVEGPSEVHIDAGDEVNLNVEASDESQILIEEQGIDEPAGVPEMADDNLYQFGAGQQARDGKLYELAGYQEVEDDVWRWNPYVVIVSAAFPAAGLLTLIIVGLL